MDLCLIDLIDDPRKYQGGSGERRQDGRQYREPYEHVTTVAAPAQCYREALWIL